MTSFGDVWKGGMRLQVVGADGREMAITINRCTRLSKVLSSPLVLSFN